VIQLKLVLYCDDSPLCKEAKRFLKYHSLEFEFVDVRTAEGNQQLLKRTQQNRFPAFEVKRSHSVGVVVGLYKNLLVKELGLDKTVQKTL